jgi:ketosteroid isomerase-like protein
MTTVGDGFLTGDGQVTTYTSIYTDRTGGLPMRMLAIFLALALTPAIAVAAPKAPPAPILKLANAVIGAANTDDASGLAGIFTNDATVVDENAPFVWRGAGAGIAWWHVVDAVTQKMKLTHLKAVNVRVTEFVQTPADAYLIEAMTITGSAAKPLAEAGTMTYTFHKTGATWLISSMVWTTKP